MIHVKPAELPNCGSVERLFRGLIADDVPAIRQIVGIALQKHGLLTLHAADGLDAWERLQTESVDIVITDVEMPRWSGVDLLNRLRSCSNERLRKLPVIVLTSLDRPKLVEYIRGFENTYFLRKPVQLRQIDVMLGLIETSRWLRLQRESNN